MKKLQFGIKKQCEFFDIRTIENEDYLDFFYFRRDLKIEDLASNL